MAKSPKKFLQDSASGGSDLIGAFSTFSSVASGNPYTIASAFAPAIIDIASSDMFVSKAKKAQRLEDKRQQDLKANEERRLRKQQELQEKKEAQRLKKQQEEELAQKRKIDRAKKSAEASLEQDKKRIAARQLTKDEMLKALKTGEMPEAKARNRFEQAELDSAFTRRRRRRNRASSKVKGGGTKKVCLPKAKVMNMSPEERRKVVAAKRSAASKGKYKRSSKSFVKGARKKGATLRDWFQKENWVQVSNPSKKCGEA